MDSASTHVAVFVSGILLVVGKIGWTGVAYYREPVSVVAVWVHILFSHSFSVVANIDPGAVYAVLFVMYGWE